MLYRVVYRKVNTYATAELMAFSPENAIKLVCSMLNILAHQITHVEKVS